MHISVAYPSCDLKNSLRVSDSSHSSLDTVKLKHSTEGTRRTYFQLLQPEYLLQDQHSACVSSKLTNTHSATFLLHHLFLCAPFLTPHREKNWGWWCITAAVWLSTSTESFYFTGSFTRGTTSPPSGRRELQPSTGGTTPWSYNSTPPRPLLMCLWGTALLCCSIYCMLTHKLTLYTMHTPQSGSVINCQTALYSF